MGLTRSSGRRADVETTHGASRFLRCEQERLAVFDLFEPLGR
jgi:hypothetical protein